MKVSMLSTLSRYYREHIVTIGERNPARKPPLCSQLLDGLVACRSVADTQALDVFLVHAPTGKR